jgi:hypothetical protein
MSLSWPPATRLPGHSATVYKLRQSLASFVPPGASDWDPGKPYSGAGGGRDSRKLQERRDLSDEVSPLSRYDRKFLLAIRRVEPEQCHRPKDLRVSAACKCPASSARLRSGEHARLNGHGQ